MIDSDQEKYHFLKMYNLCRHARFDFMPDLPFMPDLTSFFENIALNSLTANGLQKFIDKKNFLLYSI